MPRKMIPERGATSRACVAALVAGAVALFAVAMESGAEVVVCRDGTRYEGKCRITGKEVAVSRAITTSYVPRAIIDRVELHPVEQQEFERMRAGSERFAKGFCILGKWLDDHLQFEKATEYYEKCLADDPDYAEARAALGYRRDGKKWVVDPSKQLARAMLGFGDSSANACVKLAKQYDAAKQPRNVEKALRAALVAKPEHAEALALIQPYLAGHKTKNTYRRPLEGKTFAVTGHNHRTLAYMYNAVDMAKVDDAGKLYAGDGRKLESYYTYNAPVCAAASGEVIAVVDGHPDMPMGAFGDFLDANSVAIRHSGGEFTLYAHLKAGTITVRKGQMVKAGDLLGKVGNSGATAEPHLHFCVYDIDGISLPFQFVEPLAPAAPAKPETN